MNKRRLQSRFLLFAAALLLLLLVPAVAGALPDDPAGSSDFQHGLREIGARYGVTIIVDPMLGGPVPATIQEGSIDAVLQAFLEPSGYKYTKVDDYYLVSGVESPLAVLAAADSRRVLVGFLDRKAREELGEFAPYLTYDPAGDAVFVKAPAGQLHQILAKLWQIQGNVGQLAVVYNLQITDLKNSSAFDYLFSAEYDRARQEGNTWVITPDQLSSDGSLRMLTEAKAERFSESVSRQPWLITLPGETVQFRSSRRDIDTGLDIERYFTVRITPLTVNDTNGEVLSDIDIEQNILSHANLVESSFQASKDRIYRLDSQVKTVPGKRQFVAVVRQTGEVETRSIWGLGRGKHQEHRDLIITVNATPLNLQSALATTGGLMPVASLGGMEKLNVGDLPETGSRSVVTLGIGSHDAKDFVGRFELTAPLSTGIDLNLSYLGEDLYSGGFSFKMDSANAFSLELVAGKGIGPDKQDAVMVGLGDLTRPVDYLSLFAKYYPYSYLFDTQEFSGDPVWQAGLRLGPEHFGLSLEAAGNPDFTGWDVTLDLKTRNTTWFLDYNTRSEKALYGLGVKFGL